MSLSYICTLTTITLLLYLYRVSSFERMLGTIVYFYIRCTIWGYLKVWKAWARQRKIVDVEKSYSLVACPYLPWYVCSLVFPSLYLRVNTNARPSQARALVTAVLFYEQTLLWYWETRLEAFTSPRTWIIAWHVERKEFVWIIWVCVSYVPCERSVLSTGCGEGRMAKACTHLSVRWITLPLALCMAGAFFSQRLRSDVISAGQLFLTILPK